MVHHCCVPRCVSRFKKNSKLKEDAKKLTFHMFPCDTDKKQLWVVKIRRDEDALFNVNKSTRICSKHFTEASFIPNVASGRRLLKDDAIPSLFDWKPIDSTRKMPAKRTLNPTFKRRSKNVCRRKIPEFNSYKEENNVNNEEINDSLENCPACVYNKLALEEVKLLHRNVEDKLNAKLNVFSDRINDLEETVKAKDKEIRSLERLIEILFSTN